MGAVNRHIQLRGVGQLQHQITKMKYRQQSNSGTFVFGSYKASNRNSHQPSTKHGNLFILHDNIQ